MAISYRARYNHGSCGESQQGASRLGCDGCEALFLSLSGRIPHVDNSAKEEAHAHDEEKIGQDRSNHGRLDNFILSLPECDDANLRIELADA